MKKIISILLIITLLFSFAGCGSEEAESEGGIVTSTSGITSVEDLSSDIQIKIADGEVVYSEDFEEIFAIAMNALVTGNENQMEASFSSSSDEIFLGIMRNDYMCYAAFSQLTYEINYTEEISSSAAYISVTFTNMDGYTVLAAGMDYALGVMISNFENTGEMLSSEEFSAAQEVGYLDSVETFKDDLYTTDAQILLMKENGVWTVVISETGLQNMTGGSENVITYFS